MKNDKVDVSLLLEGTYPYVSGGVSSWTHELILRQNHLKFHVTTLLPRDEDPKFRYEVAPNVAAIETVHLQRLPEGTRLPRKQEERLFSMLEEPLIRLTTETATLADLARIMEAMEPHHDALGSTSLLDSEASWELLTHMYNVSFGESSMLDYFWSWRAVLAGLYSLLTVPLPDARCYHTLCTGFAGVMAARAKIETGRPVMLTEHGIYTNERRIEIASADWLEETASKALTIDRTRPQLREFWDHTFANYSRICYEACDPIITLFEGNQTAQIADGANPAKMRTIPNGVDTAKFGSLVPQPHTRPTVALIGRVVPIKDVKSFLRAVAGVKKVVPDLRALIMGPEDENPDYALECRTMAEYLALGDTVEFTGRVNIEEYLPQIDAIVLSSISEAQPLAILEAGAAGIPAVATDVGACRELLMGRKDENPKLGAGGVVVPLANTQALTEGMFRLLTDKEFHDSCGRTMRDRVARYYNKQDQHKAYRELYDACIKEKKERVA